MTEPSSLDFDGELRKHEAEIRKLDEKTKLFDDVKAKKLTLETSQQILTDKQAEQKQLSLEFNTAKAEYEQEYKKFSDLITSYNDRFREAKDACSSEMNLLGFFVLNNILFNTDSCVSPLAESSWKHMVTYESSEILIDDAAWKNDDDTEFKYPFSIPADQQLSDVIKILPQYQKKVESFKDIAGLAGRIKDLTDLRVAVEEQNVVLLEYKAKALEKAKSLEATGEDIEKLKADCKLKKKELQEAKGQWATQWTGCIQKALEEQHEELWPLLQVATQVRLRRFEQMMKPERQEHLTIKHGNQAAHEGRALADALIFQLPQSYDRYELEYVRIYGFSHTRVLEARNCSDFIDLLDLKGSLEEYRMVLPKYRSDFDKFDAAFKRMDLEIAGLEDGDALAGYFQGLVGQAICKILTAEYHTAHVKFKQYNASKR